METDETITFKKSISKLLEALAWCIFFVACGFAMGTGTISFDLGSYGIFMGWVGFVFFSGPLAMLASDLLFASPESVSVSPTGITDSRVLADPIPWSQISKISTSIISWTAMVEVKVSDEVLFDLKPTFRGRIRRFANRFYTRKETGITILHTGLEGPFSELEQTIFEYAKVHGPHIELPE